MTAFARSETVGMTVKDRFIDSFQNHSDNFLQEFVTILDEWLVSDISDAELHFLFELMERRSDTTSTIFCTQYRKDDWVKRLGEGVRAEAIVDRYAYTAFWIETGSTNMREYCAKHKM